MYQQPVRYHFHSPRMIIANSLFTTKNSANQAPRTLFVCDWLVNPTTSKDPKVLFHTDFVRAKHKASWRKDWTVSKWFCHQLLLFHCHSALLRSINCKVHGKDTKDLYLKQVNSSEITSDRSFGLCNDCSLLYNKKAIVFILFFYEIKPAVGSCSWIKKVVRRMRAYPRWTDESRFHAS